MKVRHLKHSRFGQFLPSERRRRRISRVARRTLRCVRPVLLLKHFAGVRPMPAYKPGDRLTMSFRRYTPRA